MYRDNSEDRFASRNYESHRHMHVEPRRYERSSSARWNAHKKRDRDAAEESRYIQAENVRDRDRSETESIDEEYEEDDGPWSETELFIHTETYNIGGLGYHRAGSDDDDWKPKPIRRHNSHRHREAEFDDAYYDSEPDEVMRDFSTRDYMVSSFLQPRRCQNHSRALGWQHLQRRKTTP